MDVSRLVPGILALLVGALVARFLGTVVGFTPLLIAIGLGFVLSNAVGIPAALEPGVATHGSWLAAGIVLLGASLTVETLLEAGPTALAVVLLVTGFTIVLVETLSRTSVGSGDRLGSLLAAGAGICGVSAVVAVGGAIRADREEIAYAAATILLFDAVTIVVYPVLGDLLGLSDVVFGIWAGVSMFSTGPVVAAGFAHSDAAGQWATMTKLARNALIGAVVVGYASYYARRGTGSGDGDGGDPTDSGVGASIRAFWDEFPTFVVGFLALAALASAGVFSAGQLAALEDATTWLFLLAFVGLGTEIELDALRRTGPRPVLLVSIALVAVSLLSLGLLLALF